MLARVQAPVEVQTGYIAAVARGRSDRPLHAGRPHGIATHPYGQTIHVTEGVGLCQRRGEPIEVIRPGDSVFFEPGEDHWRGAAPDRFMSHPAMQEADDQGSPVTWGDHVTEQEYEDESAPPVTSP
jgi:hypothetical protein